MVCSRPEELLPESHVFRTGLTCPSYVGGTLRLIFTAAAVIFTAAVVIQKKEVVIKTNKVIF